METVHLETSFVSLLVADPSRELITAANQQVTRDWWHFRREEFRCVASAEVVREARAGDPEQARRRLEILDRLTLLTVTPEADQLMLALLATGVLPPRAQSDAAHLAIAVAAQVNYLLTWNCRHLANAQILKRLAAATQRLGCTLPQVCTPFELMGEYAYETGPDLEGTLADEGPAGAGSGL